MGRVLYGNAGPSLLTHPCDTFRGGFQNRVFALRMFAMRNFASRQSGHNRLAQAADACSAPPAAATVDALGPTRKILRIALCSGNCGRAAPGRAEAASGCAKR